jgi:predicted SAM-dependent methyltransferase
VKLEIGAGEAAGNNPDWKYSDVRAVPGVDFVCNAWDIDEHVEDNVVEKIYSRHFFEHVTFRQGEVVLEKWLKIMKPGGVCEMMLPNMDFHVKQYISGSKPEHCRAGFWGWQRGEFEEVWDVHKSGYNVKSLSALVKSKGFVNYKSLRSTSDKHLHVTFEKAV